MLNLELLEKRPGTVCEGHLQRGMGWEEGSWGFRTEHREERLEVVLFYGETTRKYLESGKQMDCSKRHC
jgi:hypothetical protein